MNTPFRSGLLTFTACPLLAIAIAIALVATSGDIMAQAAARKPNVIVVFTDDHGYADLSCQAGRLRQAGSSATTRQSRVFECRLRSGVAFGFVPNRRLSSCPLLH